MAFCSSCGAQILEGTFICPSCGKSTGLPATSAPTSNLEDNIAGMLAYLLIPAIIFLVLEPYNRNRFVRFHSFQAIFFCVAWTVLWIGLSIIGMVPVLGWVTLLLWPIIALAGLVIFVLLMAKAYQNQMFKLPIIGDMADKQALAV